MPPAMAQRFTAFGDVFVYWSDEGVLYRQGDKSGLRLFGEGSTGHQQGLAHQTLTHSSLTINVTDKCNLRCAYCYSGQSRETRRGIGLRHGLLRKALDLFFNQLASAANEFTISFYGGEPLLRPNALRFLIDEATRMAPQGTKLGFHIYTNGTIFNSLLAQSFAEHGVVVTVSIDGDRKIHDRFRRTPSGFGTWDRVMSNLTKWKRAGCRVEASVVITHSEELLTVYELLENQVTLIKLAHCQEQEGVQRRISCETAFTLMEQVAIRYFDDLVSGRRPKVYNFDTVILQSLVGVRLRRFCGAGTNRFAIGTDGLIYPCGPAGSLEICHIGSVNDGLDEEKRKQFESRAMLNAVSWHCGGCWAQPFCGGACPLPGVREKEWEFCDFRRHTIELGLAMAYEISREHPLAFLNLLGGD